MMYKAKVSICAKISKKHSTQDEQQVEFLNVKNLVVSKETDRL